MHIAPAREAISYEEHAFTLGDKIQEFSIYVGHPSAELDLAWHNLLNSESPNLRNLQIDLATGTNNLPQMRTSVFHGK